MVYYGEQNGEFAYEHPKAPLYDLIPESKCSRTVCGISISTRADRDAMLERLRRRWKCHAEEVCLRGRNGVPVWVSAT